jgi:Holliday junction resolvase RusA-like endonuclease
VSESRRILLTVEGDAAGQPRCDAQAVFSGAQGRHVARVYTPDSADGWKSRVYLAAISHRDRPREPHRGPVIVNAVFYFARPRRLLRPSSPRGVLPYTGKPDRDNLDKVVLDALKQAGMYRDDALVHDGRNRKLYVAVGAAPGARIEVILEGVGEALFG